MPKFLLLPFLKKKKKPDKFDRIPNLQGCNDNMQSYSWEAAICHCALAKTEKTQILICWLSFNIFFNNF